MAKKKTNKAITVFAGVISLLIGTALGVFGPSLVKDINNKDNEHIYTPIVAAEGTTYDDFQIHFLELGNASTGDSIYIKAGETDILIDAGSEANSSSTIENYVNQYCKDGKLEFVISTHAHSDHIYGMVGNTSKNTKYKNYKNEVVEYDGSSYSGILFYYQVDTIIDFALSENDSSDSPSGIYTNYKKAVQYAVDNGANHYTAAECWNEQNGASREYKINEDTSLKILYNYYYFNSASKTEGGENNYSVCTLLTYKEHNFLLTGDLEGEGEEKLAAYYDGTSEDKKLPHCDLFKAGHHGSKTSSNDCLLSKITPDICCVCCCAGGSEYTPKSNNTFPTQEFINRIAKYTDQVYATSYIDEKESIVQNKLVMKSLNGTIIISADKEIDTIGIAASNNTTKLKDSNWFNETVYLDSDGNICSGKKKTDFYQSDSPNVTASPRRTWPSYK